MCRITPNQFDKNPCVNLCPEINERLTGIINIDAAALRATFARRQFAR
jgi:hypothetical protein